MSTGGPSVKGTFGLDNSALRRGTVEAQGILNNFKSNASKAFSAVASAAGPMFTPFSVGMAAVVAAGVAMKKFADFCGEAVDSSKRFNTTVETIQRVDYVAQQAGASIEDVGKVLNQLAVKAKEGSDQFEEVGINAKQFLNLDMDGRLLMLAKAYEECNGNQEKMAALLELVGGRGSKIFPLLAEGADGLKKAMGEINPVTQEVAQNMDYLGDRVEFLKRKAISASAAVVGFVDKAGQAIGQGLYDAFGGHNGQKLDPIDIMLDPAKMAADQKTAREQGAGRVSEDPVSQAEKTEEVEKRIQRLKERNAELTRESALDALKSSDKAFAIEQEIAELKGMYEATSADNEEQRLRLQGEILEKEKELRSVMDDIHSEAEKSSDELARAEKEQLSSAEKEAKLREKIAEDMAEAAEKAREITAEELKRKVEDRLKSPDERRAERKEEGRVERATNALKQQAKDKADRDRRAAGDTGFRPQIQTPAEKRAEEERIAKENQLPADVGANTMPSPADQKAADPIQPPPDPNKGKAADPKSQMASDVSAIRTKLDNIASA